MTFIPCLDLRLSPLASSGSNSITASSLRRFQLTRLSIGACITLCAGAFISRLRRHRCILVGRVYPSVAFRNTRSFLLSCLHCVYHNTNTSSLFYELLPGRANYHSITLALVCLEGICGSFQLHIALICPWAIF